MSKRLIGCLGVAVLCFNLIFMGIQASAAEVYGSDYNISTILSRYQFMVETDVKLDGGGHTVGAIVVGGTLEMDNTFGDAATVPSYIEHLKKGMFGNAWHGKYPTKNETVYYNTSAVGGLDSNIWKQNPDYIAVDEAFTAVKQQSKTLAASGTKVTAVNNVVTIDCTGAEDVNVCMSADTYTSASQIKILVDSVDWFREHTCLISVTGGDGLSFDGYSKVCMNNAGVSNQLKNMTGSDGEYGSQLNVGGMNLVWNFPDVTGTMEVKGLGGHLVAPNAGVNFASGNYEGGVICKALSGGAEGHFYPMSRQLPNEEEPDEPQPEPGDLTAQGSFSKLDEGGNQLAGAVFTLMYSGSSNLSKVERVSGPALSSKTGISIVWKSTTQPLVLTGLPVGTYALVETEAPTGYLYAPSVAFEVKSDGKIYRGSSQSDSIQMTDKKIEKINVQVSKKWEDNNDVARRRPASISVQLKKQIDEEEPTNAGELVTLNASNRWSFQWTGLDKTDLSGNMITYTVEEVNVPEGYTTNQTADVSGNIVITNTYTASAVTAEGSFSKQDAASGTELPGAELKLTIAQGDLSQVKALHAAVENHFTASAASVSWISTNTPLLLSQLPAGEYTMTETQAPGGYKVAESISFTIDAAGDIYCNGSKTDKIVMKDEALAEEETPTGNLKVTVTDEKTGERVPDATVSIKKQDSKESITEKTDQNGNVEIPDLEPGEYTVTVEEVPDGYTVTTDTKVTVTVEEGKTAEQEIKVKKEDAGSSEDPGADTPTTPGGTEVSKERGHLTIVVYDEETGERVPDATITITGPDGVSREYTTNSTGEVELVYILVGDYTIKVSSVPDGYTVTTDKEFTATVVKGETTKKEIKVAGASINDEDDEDDEDDDSDKEQTSSSSKKTDNASQKTGNSAKTGDEAPIALNVAIMLVAAAGFVLLQLRRNRQD